MTSKGLQNKSSDKNVIECEVGTVRDVVYLQSVSVNASEDDSERWFLFGWEFVGHGL